MLIEYPKQNGLLYRTLLITIAAAGLPPLAFGLSGVRSGVGTTRNTKGGGAMKHVVVYHEDGMFCGWPANRGVWSWGDEILVGFTLGHFQDKQNRHAIDRDKPRENGILARSLDGGLTWSIEKPAALMSSFVNQQSQTPCPGGLNFSGPDFAMTCRGDRSREGRSRFQVSSDRGRTWSQPYMLPMFGQKRIMARTDYIVNGRGSLLVFLTAAKRNGKEGRVLCARTTDGGRTFGFVSWVCPEPTGYAIMPSTVRISKAHLVSAIRRYERGDINQGWINVYVSEDDGRTWLFLAKAAATGEHGGNPPSMVRLKDGRLCITYGYRSKPYGIRAVFSSDNGKSWSDPVILRDDGRNWDLGYCRTIVRPDGKLVTIYYYATAELYNQHIAATIWDPAKVTPVQETHLPQSCKPDHSKVPGVVIDYSPAKSQVYLGCPGIAKLPDGQYVASHSVFGPGSTRDTMAIFRSGDKGKSWEKLTDIKGQWWSSLFVHNGSLYIMGTSGRYGNAVIRRSDDGGKTWTVPKDENTGLLFAGGCYHTAPVPVVVHNGRIWRAMEYLESGKPWGSFQAFVMSAPVDADLLKAENWTYSNRLIFRKEWAPDEERAGWLEGNIVLTPQGKLVNILRVNFLEGEKAAVIRISDDGRKIFFDPKKDIIEFPGGATKFTIRYDGISRRYYSLTNHVPKRDKALKASLNRNTLALISSADLKNWRIESIILHHPDVKKHAWQYVDWLFEGDDMIFVSRTAYDDGLGGAHRQHDANYFTFHRIRKFRTKGSASAKE